MSKALFARGDLSVTQVLTRLRVKEIIANYFDARPSASGING